MRKLLLLSVSALLFTSCHTVYFAESQPTYVESQLSIPSDFHGDFILESLLEIPVVSFLDSLQSDFRNKERYVSKIEW